MLDAAVTAAPGLRPHPPLRRAARYCMLSICTASRAWRSATADSGSHHAAHIAICVLMWRELSAALRAASAATGRLIGVPSMCSTRAARRSTSRHSVDGRGLRVLRARGHPGRHRAGHPCARGRRQASASPPRAPTHVGYAGKPVRARRRSPISVSAASSIHGLTEGCVHPIHCMSSTEPSRRASGCRSRTPTRPRWRSCCATRAPCSACPMRAPTRASSATRARRRTCSALGARDGRALARGGRAPAHVGDRRPLRPARPRPARGGLPADVVIFDPDTVGCGPLRRVRDFPAGADRLVSDAIGIRAVVVEGTPIREDGRDVVDPEGPLPGHVLRGGKRSDRAQEGVSRRRTEIGKEGS